MPHFELQQMIKYTHNFNEKTSTEGKSELPY